MKEPLFLLTFFVTVICHAQHAREFKQKINQQFHGENFSRIHPLEASTTEAFEKSDVIKRFTSKLKRFSLLAPSADFKDIKNSIDLRKNIELAIPVADSTLTIKLVPNKITTENFVIRTAKGQEIKSHSSINNHYYGFVKDLQSSFAAISFSSNSIRGMISTEHNNFFVEPIHGASSMALYDQRDLTITAPDLNCTTDDRQYEESFDGFSPDSIYSPVACKTVRMYLECSFSLYTYLGSDINTAVDYIFELFNTSSVLFKREGINLQIGEIYIWDREDIYANAQDIYEYINLFKNRLSVDRRFGNRIQADIAHALTHTGFGVSAASGNIRNCENVNVAVSTGLGRFGPFPVASYPITLFSHETGHQLGSPHTHSCSWPGGPIDNCAPIEDGFCQPGPTPVGGGSIMSYCSSIDFNKGIGPLPGALIRSIIDGASCLQSCGTGACENLNVRNITANLTDTALLIRWSQQSLKYRVGIKPNTTRKWTYYEVTGDSLHVLKSRCETAYEYSVSAFCSEENKYAINNILRVGIADANSLSIPFPLQSVSVCSGNSAPLRLKPDTSAMIYQWYVNDVPDPALTSGLIRVSRPGKYQATGFMDGCSYTSDTILVTRRRNPPTLTCSVNKLTAVFTGTTGCGKRMLWEFGDGNTDTASNPVHVYSHYGTYRVILKAWDAEGVMDSVVTELILFESITDEFNGESDPGQPVSVRFDKNFHCQQAAVFARDSILHKGQAVVWYNETNSSKLISYPRTGTFEIKIFPDSATKKNTFEPLLQTDTGLIMIARNTPRKFILEFSRWGGVQFNIDSFLIGNLQPGLVGPLRFHEWNTIGISYGSKGVEMLVNGISVGKIDKPIDPLSEKYVAYTIGYFSNIIRNDNYTFTGFAGGVDKIRFSNLERDYTFSAYLASQGTDTVFQSKSICHGDSYQGHTRSGTYHTSNKTAEGCDSISTIELIVGAEMQLEDSVVHAGNSPDGSIVIKVKGGFPPYLFKWNTGNTTADIRNLPAGTYTVTVTDKLNCSVSARYKIYAGKQPGESFRVLPNPAREQQRITLQITSEQASSYDLIITDILGRQLSNSRITVSAGINHIAFRHKLRHGYYLFTLRNSGKQFGSLKIFVK